LLLVAIPYVESDPAVSDKFARFFEIIAMSAYLVPLSLASLFALIKLNYGCFRAEQFRGIRIKMVWLEILIQFVIYARLAIGWVYNMTSDE
jgi:hypothetical protein